MIVRKIKPAEVKRTEELFSISFDSPYNNEASSTELYESYISNPTSREQEHPLERYAAFEDDDTTMMSCFFTQPFEVSFDGHNESMYSIGGVATLPQYRKRGGIRSCFEKAFPCFYEQGAVFSYLYPFSTAYYRKFGYELCCRKQVYRVALQHIPAYQLSGSCYLLDASTRHLAKKDIPAIYDIWQKNYNMMVLGTSYDFAFIQAANPYKEQVFTYVYRSAVGTPLAYMTFRNNTSPDCRRLECSSFFYINREGLQGLLALAKSFASDYRHICFSLPEGPALEQILPEWSMGAVGCELIPHGMVRIINVQKALQDAAYRGSGHISLKVTDSYIPENNRSFAVTFADNICTEVTPYDGDADISLSISSLSALLTGGYETSAISLFADVQVHKNADCLWQIFYKKPVYITSSF